MTGFRKTYFTRIILLVVLTAVVSACRTARDVPADRIRAVSAERLLKQVEEHAFDFTDLTVRRINVQFSEAGIKTNFRASIRATKNEKVMASFTKLNIPVGRVLLTPDSVRFINYIEKNYFEGDYSYLTDMLNFGITFDMVQAIISNPVNNDAFNNGILRQYDSRVENGKYVLQNVNQKTSQVPERKRYTIRNSRNSGPAENSTMVLQKMVFHPQSYVLERLEMEDPAGDRKLEVNFSDFVKIDTYDYPGEIDIRMVQDDEVTALNIKMRGFSTEKVDSLELVIPDRYQRIRMKR
jgi:outer membrane lipoprotein-sorting protein